MKNSFSHEYKEVLSNLEDYIVSGYRSRRTGIYDSEDSSPEKRINSLNELNDTISGCVKCLLHESRKNTVPGQGVPNPLVLIIGEGPGKEEDEQGVPFVGKAGKYLDSWMNAIGLSREQNCYIANIVKCRPPQNRDPLPEEKTCCLPYLEQQITLLSPKIIFCLGRIAAQTIFQSEDGIGRLRGRTGSWNTIPVLATYHPSAVLRNQELKRPVWEDLKRLRTMLDTFDD